MGTRSHTTAISWSGLPSGGSTGKESALKLPLLVVELALGGCGTDVPTFLLAGGCPQVSSTEHSGVLCLDWMPPAPPQTVTAPQGPSGVLFVPQDHFPLLPGPGPSSPRCPQSALPPVPHLYPNTPFSDVSLPDFTPSALAAYPPSRSTLSSTLITITF